MKITSNGWYNIIFSFLFIIVLMVPRIVAYLKMKKRDIGKIVYVDNFNPVHIIFMFISFVSSIVLLINIISGVYNKSDSSMPITVGFILMCISPAVNERIVVSHKGIGCKDLFGGIDKFICWETQKEYKWKKNYGVKIIKRDGKMPSFYLHTFISNKKEIILLINQYDNNNHE